jgi:pyridoxamine 5'-phosphate oxidase
MNLDVDNVAAEPIEQFRIWLREAEARELPQHNAMTLATATPAGVPSARIVLLKEVDDRGFVFYTNYESRKAVDLEENPRAALVFYWEPFGRQVRIEGFAERVSAADSNAYFASRPRESRIGALASRQSRPLRSRAELDQRVATITAQLGDREPMRPPWWGGYRVVPERIELWQARPGRLHDRIEYRRGQGSWTCRRLSP